MRLLRLWLVGEAKLERAKEISELPWTQNGGARSVGAEGAKRLRIVLLVVANSPLNCDFFHFGIVSKNLGSFHETKI
jgi:hypothetical protein